MKTPSRTLLLSVVGAASSVLLPASHASAQTTVATSPVGYLQTSCLSASDTLIAPSFTRPAVFTGAVASTTSGSTTGTVTLSSTSLTASAYDAPTTNPATKDTYYLLVGPATATLTGTLTVTQGSTAVTGNGTTFGTDIKVGDRLTINDGYNLLTYSVAAIGSTTSLTLDRAFADAAAPNSFAPVAPVARTNATKSGSAGTNTTASTSSLGGLSATYDHSPYEGRYYQVTTNGTGTVTVNLNGDSLSSIAAGTQVSIIPYWTLNSIFPASGSGVSFTPTTSLFSPKTQILIPDYVSSGINLSTTVIYFYYNDGGSNVGWRAVGSTTVDRGFDPLLPDGYMTVRTPSGAPALPVTFSGAVPTNKLVTTLTTRISGAQDNAVALNRPADATIASLGLSPSDGSFVPTTSLFSPKDQILVYNNAITSFNKSASAIYYYIDDGGSNVGWRVVGDSTTNHGTDLLPAGSALTIRKASTTSGASAVWTKSPNY